MATTTNYGWTTPDDTALVKDGAAAIRTLGSSIDTSLNTALGTKKAGLVLLNTTSFSGVSSASLPADTFTSTYDNYRILYNVTPSTSLSNQIRFRTAGSDNTTANYSFSYNIATTTWSLNRNTGQTRGYFTPGTTATQQFVIDVFSPKLTANTQAICYGYTTQTMTVSGVSFDTTTSFDSMSFVLDAAGTISGTIWAYGYNK